MVLRVCLPQVFLAWHFPLLGFLNLSAVLLLGLPGLFHPGNALGILLQSFLLQEIGFLFRGSVPSCPWLLRVRCRDLRVAPVCRYEFAVWLQGFLPS